MHKKCELCFFLKSHKCYQMAMNLVQPSKVNHKVRNELNIQNNIMNVNKLLSEPFEEVSMKDKIRGIVD